MATEGSNPKGAAQKGASQKGTVQKGAQPSTAPSAAVAVAAPSEPKLQLEPHQVLLRPLVTEKGMHRSTRYNAYAFEINKLATKLDVRRAVESLFDVRVVRVHIQNRKGKPRR